MKTGRIEFAPDARWSLVCSVSGLLAESGVQVVTLRSANAESELSARETDLPARLESGVSVIEWDDGEIRIDHRAVEWTVQDERLHAALLTLPTVG